MFMGSASLGRFTMGLNPGRGLLPFSLREKVAEGRKRGAGASLGTRRPSSAASRHLLPEGEGMITVAFFNRCAQGVSKPRTLEFRRIRHALSAVDSHNAPCRSRSRFRTRCAFLALAAGRR